MRMIWVMALLAACDGGKDTEPTDDTDPTDTTDTTDDTDTTDTTDSDEELIPTDEERAMLLWTALNGFESWPQQAPWTGVQPQADGSPHGPYVQVWLNTLANDAYADVTAETSDFPAGSVLVKRLYDDAAGTMVKPEIFAMWKVEGFDAANGDWFWAKFDEAGNAEPYGAVGMCSGCHSTGKDFSRIVTDVPGAM